MEGKMFHKNFKEGSNPLHSEHLKDGVKPIMFCAMGEDFKGLTELSGKDSHVEKIDHSYILNLGKVSDKGIYNTSNWIGVISEFNNRNKFSDEHRSCIGLVVVGTSIENETNVSFMLHIDALYFLKETDSFTSTVNKYLETVLSSCVPGTIDAVIYGGRTDLDSHNFSINPNTFIYNKTIDIVGEKIKSQLGFEPVVYRPKSLYYNNEGTVVYFDNTNRRLYLAQEEKDNQEKKQTFIPSQKHNTVPEYKKIYPDGPTPSASVWG